MNRQQKDFYKTFSQHGEGAAQVVIKPQEVLMLLQIAYVDLNGEKAPWFNSQIEEIAEKGFYGIKYGDIARLPAIDEDACFQCMLHAGVADVNNIEYLYFKCLCLLYRRRFKYYHILRTQPLPNSDQIAPRCLLEFGNCDNRLLATWLEWRKWIFDIDNRCAQETGYVFEPILVSCLGGESVPALYSPIKHIDENGQITNRGRQIDCYLSESREAYELKMRVTVAASGQGRFKEELSFAAEASRVGIVPILVVFDENPSPNLSKLKKEFISNGGKCYIGKEAWQMLSEKAGKEKGMFINKYIYPPIHEIEVFLGSRSSKIWLERKDGEILIGGLGDGYRIKRDD